jgi:hypothetical protein
MAFAGCLDCSKEQKFSNNRLCKLYFLTHAIGYGRLLIAEGSRGSISNIMTDVGEYMAEVGGIEEKS